MEWKSRRGGTRRPPPPPVGSLAMGGANHEGLLTLAAVEKEVSPASGASARGRGSRLPAARRRATAAARAARESLDAAESAITGGFRV